MPFTPPPSLLATRTGVDTQRRAAAVGQYFAEPIGARQSHRRHDTPSPHRLTHTVVAILRGLHAHGRPREIDPCLEGDDVLARTRAARRRRQTKSACSEPEGGRLRSRALDARSEARA